MKQTEAKPPEPVEVAARRAALRARIHATIPFGRDRSEGAGPPAKR